MPNHILELLQSPKSGMGSIVETVQAIQALNHWIQKRLPLELKPHCQVGLYKKGVLTLVASSPAWATNLRFLSSELLQKLRQEPRWIGICSIQIKVGRLNPVKIVPMEAQPKDHGIFYLSAEAAESFRTLAQELDQSISGNDALKKTLLRLSKFKEE